MNNEIREAAILRTPAPYPGIIFEVVDYPDKPGISVLRFYAQNLADFSDNKLTSIAEWMDNMLAMLNASNLGRSYTYEIRESPC